MAALRTLAGRVPGALRAAGPARMAIAVLGVAGAILLVVAEFSTIAEIEIGSATCDSAVVASRDDCQVTGLEQHGGALFLLAALALAMAFGAARGRSRPAAVALIAIAGIVLAFALTRDLPKTKETGLTERNYAQVSAQAGGGFTAELVGGALLLVAGGIGCVQPRREDEGARS